MEREAVEDLRTELLIGRVRLFRNPDGQLTKVRDHVQLRVAWIPPGGLPEEASYLVRETEPRGFPSGLRRSKDSLETTANSMIVNDLPDFMRFSLDISFEGNEAVWLVENE